MYTSSIVLALSGPIYSFPNPAFDLSTNFCAAASILPNWYGKLEGYKNGRKSNPVSDRISILQEFLRGGGDVRLSSGLYDSYSMAFQPYLYIKPEVEILIPTA